MVILELKCKMDVPIKEEKGGYGFDKANNANSTVIIIYF